MIRINRSTGIITVLVLLIAAVALILAFTVENSEELLYGSFFIQTMLAMLIVLGMLISLSFEGSRWNQELEYHK